MDRFHVLESSLMNPSSRDLRRAAEKAFKDSLDQLQETLEVPPIECAESDIFDDDHFGDRECLEAHPVNLTDWEEAVADIEQFIRAQYPESEGND